MSLRATFLLLLFANLAFFGWATLIDVPPEPPANDSISKLPQLKLLSEVHGRSSSSASSSAPPGSSTPMPGSTPSAPAGTASGMAASSTSVAPSLGPGTPIASASRMAERMPGADSVAAGASQRCITVGPFADPEHAREATALLRERGFSPRQRAAPSQPEPGYWVFIAGLKSPSDEASVLRRLERSGIADARAMSASDTSRRVSVGLFNALGGAERRARAVRRLGLDAQVEPRPAEIAHWLDVNLDSSSQSLPAEGLLSLEEAGSRLEIKECPSASQDGRSGDDPHKPGPKQDEAGSRSASPATKAPGENPDFRPVIPRPLTAAGRPRPG